jgi:hypothetical protein
MINDSLISAKFELPTGFIFLLLAFIVVNALVWIRVPVKMAMRGEVLEGLKRE